jgi:ectoine hydroxylase-related dioxygenase (phytanoyl-CoA dioxygenase family)
VRAILFDKRPESNWRLPLHQDVAIAVRERIETPGFGPWSTKDGVPHVQPPAPVLEGMITVRLHLDRADERSGCLRVVPGSHQRGKLSAGSFETRPGCGLPVVVNSGDAVLMRPLVLHGSERNETESRRRVLHLEFSFDSLPGGLAWHVPKLAPCAANALP